MKTKFLTLLLLTSINLFAHDTTEKHSVDEGVQWRKDFNSFLVEHDNPNIAVMGLMQLPLNTRLLGYSNPNSDDIEIQNYADKLNDLVRYEKLSTQSLLMIANICQNQKIHDLCENESILDKMVEQEPQNLSIYITAFSIAVADKDEVQIKLLLNLMEKTRFSNNYQVPSVEFYNVLTNYVNKYPLPQGSFENDMKLIKSLGNMPEDKKNELSQNQYEHQLFMVKFNYKLTMPILSYRDIITTCESSSVFFEPCLKVAKIMMDNSKSLISTLVGYSVNTKISKLFGSQKQADNAEQLKKAYRINYECIIAAYSAGRYSLDNNFSIKSFEIGIKTEREKSEFEAFKQLAELIYQKLLEQGDEAAKDPSLCFK